MKKIFIDAGHGGRDSGAVCKPFKESDLNLAVAKAAGAELGKYECEVVYSRTGDTPTRINDMCALAKKIGAAASVSIHHNAGGGRGGEAFYWRGDAAARRLAGLVAREFKAAGQTLRCAEGEEPGVKPSYADPPGHNFGMCRINAKNGIPAVLGEYAFVDSPKDRAMIDTPAKLAAEGLAYAKALVTFLHLKKREVKPPDEPAQPRLRAGAAVRLEGAKLYRSSDALEAARTVTGGYYLYDGVTVRGRCRVTKCEEYVCREPARLFVTGWVDREALRYG